MQKDKARFDLARQLHLSGKIEEAQKIYAELCKKYKHNHILFYLLGTTFLQIKKYDQAIFNLEKSININSNYPDSYNNLGVSLAETKKYSEAIEKYNKAIVIKNDYIDAYLNRGISLNKLKKYNEAIKDFNLVIKYQPENIKAYNNLGNVFKNLNKLNDAINEYDKAIKINENFLEAISNKADTLESQKKFDKALIELNKINSKNPNFLGLYQKIISNKMSIFNWDSFDTNTNLLKEKILNKEITITPLFIYYLFDDPKLQKINSVNFIKNEFKNYKKITLNKKNKLNKKIKIGYFCGDFHNHPVLHIMSGIFKNHNKNNFEIYAFSHGPNKKDNIWRNDVMECFKKFHDINEMTDYDIVKLVNSENIDIAVNLTGLTENAKTSIFYNRVAPIQINYLGFTGTIGLESIDYIIADEITIPKDQKKYYTEKVCYLPTCYIPHADNIEIKYSNEKFSRSDFGLPENKIVFCAFHNPHKINPQIFDCWVNIIKKVEDSVLWIKSEDEKAKDNLINEAKKRGLDPKRVIFAKGTSNINEHIERLKLADILLDTYPYASHSTIYDYFKAYLPAVIRQGNSFPSRVASSIYSSVGLSELVAKSNLDYEKIAVDLASNKTKLLKVRNKIKTEIKNNYVFDAKKYTANLENIYSEIVEKKIN